MPVTFFQDDVSTGAYSVQAKGRVPRLRRDRPHSSLTAMVHLHDTMHLHGERRRSCLGSRSLRVAMVVIGTIGAVTAILKLLMGL